MSKHIYLLVGLLAIAVGFGAMVGVGQVESSAPSGLPANQAIATTTAIGPQENKTIFSAHSNCSSRVVRTQGQAIVLIFGDPSNGDISSSTLKSVVGFTQAASTTQAYDSGIYGCGRMMGFAESSTTITVAEFR